MSYVYDKSGQNVYFQREGSTYGKIYDPETSGLTAFTSIPANYVHWRRLDYIPDAFDPIIPLIEKLKQYDTSDGKHASAIASGNIKETDFTLSMDAQGLEFLLLAIGAPALSSHTRAMVQSIRCPLIASIADLSYFILDVVLDADTIDHYLLWFDQDGGGTAPTSPIGIADANRAECAIDGATTVQGVATIVAAAIDGLTDVSAISSETDTDISFAGSVITRAGGDFQLPLYKAGETIIVTGDSENNGTYTIVSATVSAITVTDTLTTESAGDSVVINSERVQITGDNSGAVVPVRQGDEGGETGLTYTVETWGVTTYTVAELLTSALPSFTMHVEQLNTTTADSIIWDLFGCVVESVTVNVSWGDSLVKYEVMVKCPYALESALGVATNPPPKKLIQTMSSMTALQENTNAALIQEGATCTLNGANDKTPQAVETVSFTISNNIKFYPDLATRYATKACTGKRDVTLNVVGLTTEKDLFTYWQGAYALDGTDYIPTSASGKLNTTFHLLRDATYDYVSIHVYNWLLKEHNFTFVNVDDAVKKVDMTFEDGTGDSNGRILDSTTFVSYIDSTIMVV